MNKSKSIFIRLQILFILEILSIFSSVIISANIFLIPEVQIVKGQTTNNASVTPQAFLSFNNTFYGITMKYPANWIITSYYPTLVTFDSPETRFNHRVAEVLM